MAGALSADAFTSVAASDFAGRLAPLISLSSGTSINFTSVAATAGGGLTLTYTIIAPGAAAAADITRSLLQASPAALTSALGVVGATGVTVNTATVSIGVANGSSQPTTAAPASIFSPAESSAIGLGLGLGLGLGVPLASLLFYLLVVGKKTEKTDKASDDAPCDDVPVADAV